MPRRYVGHRGLDLGAVEPEDDGALGDAGRVQGLGRHDTDPGPRRTSWAWRRGLSLLWRAATACPTTDRVGPPGSRRCRPSRGTAHRRSWSRHRLLSVHGAVAAYGWNGDQACPSLLNLHLRQSGGRCRIGRRDLEAHLGGRHRRRATRHRDRPGGRRGVVPVDVQRPPGRCWSRRHRRRRRRTARQVPLGLVPSKAARLAVPLTSGAGGGKTSGPRSSSELVGRNLPEVTGSLAGQVGAARLVVEGQLDVCARSRKPLRPTSGWPADRRGRRAGGPRRRGRCW